MILPQLRDDLVAAAARERAPRSLPPVAAALAAVVVAVVLARGGELEREVAIPAPQRLTLAVPDTDPPLAFAAWTSAGGLLCTRLEGRIPERACGNGFVLAEDLGLDGVPLSHRVSRHGDRYVLAGVAVPYVSLLDVTSRDGTRARARLSADTVGVPVRVDPGGLTEAGRRFAASLPDVLRVRPFAVSLPRESAPRELHLSVTPNKRVEMSVRIPLSLLDRPSATAATSASSGFGTGCAPEWSAVGRQAAKLELAP